MLAVSPEMTAIRKAVQVLRFILLDIEASMSM